MTQTAFVLCAAHWSSMRVQSLASVRGRDGTLSWLTAKYRNLRSRNWCCMAVLLC